VKSRYEPIRMGGNPFAIASGNVSGGMIRSEAAGVMLIELMVATVVFLFVAAGGMRFLILQHQWAVSQEQTAEAQQQIRAAMDFMERELGLLGFGLPEGQTGMLAADFQDVEFLANLHAAAAGLATAAQPGQSGLTVYYYRGADYFEKGRTIQICGRDFCERRTLARDGETDHLELTEGVSTLLGPGSTIQVLNRVQYELRPMQGGPFKLIRTVDGGANAVAEGLSSMELIYRDRQGQETASLADIRRVQIRLTAEPSGGTHTVRVLSNEIYLRNG
jgi:type II secretory pathway pseudopilin PulG